MICTSAEIKSVEAQAFADGIQAADLMEEAGVKIARAIRQFFPQPARCLAVFGKGHNGGDALVAARHLALAGWAIETRPAFPEAEWAGLTTRNLRALMELLEKRTPVPPVDPRLVVLDGLLGVGASGPLREPIRAAAREVNRLRRENYAHIFALDLPTGLDADTGAADPDAVLADITLTIGCAKTGLLADGATKFVGRLAALPLEELTKRLSASTGPQVATRENLASLLPRRPFDLHKGDCGRIGILAGSPGFTGAAIMAAEACVHAGAGLVTLYVSNDAHPLVASRIAPEVMVKPVASFLEILDAKHDVLAIGPGLGTGRAEEILAIIERASQPMIVDADALNVLSTHLQSLDSCAGPRLLTPHPGEMARLFPEARKLSRAETVAQFNARFPAALLLKGARTVIGQSTLPLSYNTTGTPGMATGGMGDVLTGVLASVAGQGLSLYDSARLGAWLCGRAAEFSITHRGESEESLSATHVIANLGAAFRALRDGGF